MPVMLRITPTSHPLVCSLEPLWIAFVRRRLSLVPAVLSVAPASHPLVWPPGALVGSLCEEETVLGACGAECQTSASHDAISIPPPSRIAPT